MSPESDPKIMESRGFPLGKKYFERIAYINYNDLKAAQNLGIVKVFLLDYSTEFI